MTPCVLGLRMDMLGLASQRRPAVRTITLASVLLVCACAADARRPTPVLDAAAEAAAAGATAMDASLRPDAALDGAGPDDGCGKPDERLRPSSDLQSIAHCTTLHGSLNLGDSMLEDLDPLGNLRVVEGTLNLFRNEYLKDIRGLHNLERVGGALLIHNGATLQTLEGLERLEAIGGELFIDANRDLRSVDGLSHLRSVGGDLVIRSNAALPQAAAERLAAKVSVGGMITISGNL